MDLPFDVENETAKIDAAHEREEEDVTKILGEKYDLPYADLSLTAIDTEALRLIPEDKAREAEVVAFEKTGTQVSLALHNPNNPALESVVNDLKSRNIPIKEFLVSRKSLAKAYARYVDLSFATKSKAGVFDIGGQDLIDLRAKVTSLSALAAMLNEAKEGKGFDRTSKIIEVIFAGALALKASDIHSEPEEGRARLRFRLDGLLTDIFFFDLPTYHLVSARIKLLAGVKLNVANRAQDGRFSIDGGESAVEIRASFIPDPYGESVVLRILDPSVIHLIIKELGISPKLLARLEKEIRRSNGMLLNTGPTGSGKTTTLYTFLKDIHTPEIKIITIEDPIEYHLEGIVQTQADGKNYTFASGLRAIVRQDPDVIMVGEIRDGETANIAIEAALTGHFVFSTLHTNNAAGTFPRLIDLGADPKAFGSAVSVSMAQRLARKLDPARKKERALTDKEKRMIEKLFANVTDKSLVPTNMTTAWDPVPEGEITGYKGRVGIYEAIFMDDELGTYLRENPSESDIAKSVVRQGYLTMAQEGVAKALEGLTSLEEIADTVDLPYE